MPYVKITGPEGVTLTNPGKEGGTFEYENNESKYTYKMSVLYEQDAKAAEVTKWSPNRDLKKYSCGFLLDFIFFVDK